MDKAPAGQPSALDAALGAGLSRDEVQGFLEARPTLPTEEAASSGPIERLDADAARATAFYKRGSELLRRLPPKPARSDRERAAAESIHASLRDVRTRFLRAYGAVAYAELTRGYRDFVRAEPLVYAAAERFPGLVPSRAEVLAERELLQKDKEGAEIDQGIFFAQILSSPRAGAHLCHAMQRPREESRARLGELLARGSVDLGAALVERDGKVGRLTLKNPRFLNAEDDSTTDAIEIGVDLVLLHPAIEVGVLRGDRVEHRRYAGRRVFNAGINLTHLYHGKISFLFYVTRDLGYVSKIYRGLAGDEIHPGEPEDTIEKPWIAAVETFAIGGGCQLLLVMDRVLAEEGSYFNLPARKEGIIPGAANLRMTRFTGGRLARQSILFGRDLPVGSPEAAHLCDEVVPQGGMDAAIEQAALALTGSGLVSAASNRKAIRMGEEPLDVFRMYMATYAREQAKCHFSPALIDNLERNWDAKRRSL